MGRKGVGHTIIAVVPDAFGGRGGIALYNRLLLRAICSAPNVEEVIALPRSVTYDLEAMPANLRFERTAAGGKIRYIAAVLALAAKERRANLVVCCHLHLFPFAWLLGWRFGCPVLPVIYGLEAWQPTPHRIANLLCRQVRAFVSIRKYTAECFKSWAATPDARMYYLPNAIDLADFGVAPRRADLIEKHGLAGRTVVMTTGRIETIPVECNKGFEEVLETLPALAHDVPNIAYLIMGDGVGRADLEAKARALGIADRVIFTGYVPENEKADHYRLADVVAMPGSNPMFDRYPFRFAFLEPLACGVPVVGARLEDPTERDDPDACELLIQVDPSNSVDIKRGILEGLARKGRGINPVLHRFGYNVFEKKVFAILADVDGRQGKS